MGWVSQTAAWFRPSETETPPFIAKFRKHTLDDQGATMIERGTGITSREIDRVRQMSPIRRGLVAGFGSVRTQQARMAAVFEELQATVASQGR